MKGEVCTRGRDNLLQVADRLFSNRRKVFALLLWLLVGSLARKYPRAVLLALPVGLVGVLETGRLYQSTPNDSGLLALTMLGWHAAVGILAALWARRPSAVVGCQWTVALAVPYRADRSLIL